MNKKDARLKRARKTRSRIRLLEVHRLTVHRTPRHIYAQVLAPDGATVVACASTVDKTLKKQVKYSGNVDAAAAVGKAIAERAKEAGITKVAFDRSGFKYHGRIRALAEAARENGMEF
ncbi:MAG TPA: 50S ribosomal protein L18 [Gammaproteobacteria bacterium]|nr:50S ribosomal protein L18 [Gammaproteobacteria bacterium]